MAQTFSPTVSSMPDSAAPIASPSQLFLATEVDPKPGMTTGNLTFIPLSCPICLSSFALGKMALSGSGSTPCAPTHVPIMVK